MICSCLLYAMGLLNAESLLIWGAGNALHFQTKTPVPSIIAKPKNRQKNEFGITALEEVLESELQVYSKSLGDKDTIHLS